MLIMFFSRILSQQNAIASHESNGIDIIIALILNDINPLGKTHMDLVLELKVSRCISTPFHFIFLYCCCRPTP